MSSDTSKGITPYRLNNTCFQESSFEPLMGLPSSSLFTPSSQSISESLEIGKTSLSLEVIGHVRDLCLSSPRLAYFISEQQRSSPFLRL
jgi:hypothetical protein